MTLVSPAGRTALRHRLAARDTMLGCSLDYPTVGLAVDLAGRFDILFIDCEHGGPGIESVPALVAAARACGRPALVRPWSKEPGLARRLLDCGAEGLIWPDLESADELQALSRALANSGHGDAVLVLLIETLGAVSDLDAILGHPATDGLLIGPGDLAAAHGLDRRSRDDGQSRLHQSILARAAAAGKAAGGPVVALGEPLMTAGQATLWMHSAAGLIAAGIAGLGPLGH